LQVEALEDRNVPSAYLQTNLASDVPGQAQVHDPELVDAWGLSINPNGTFWPSARATDVSTVYSGDVTPAGGTFQPFIKRPLTVTIPGGKPTGQVFNGSSDTFIVSAGGRSAPARFIFASETGHITAWNPTVPTGGVPQSREAFIMASTPGAVYTGLAIDNLLAGNFIYAADFANGKIDVFDRTYTPTTLAGNFTDPAIPADYAPFNIWELGGKLYVTYARQENGGALPDGGNGFVSVFDLNGNLVTHLVDDSHLQQPWGLALAPADFGEFSNTLLVANTADGTINAHDPTTGDFLGRLADASGETIHIDGLWALHFGNGTVSGDRNALYFTAAPNNHEHGLFGSLRVAPAQVASVVVNDGDAQRSMVNSVTVTFDGPVTLDTGAFEVRRQDGQMIDLNAVTSLVKGRTVVVLTFTGSGVSGGSLADGNYTLTIRSDRVHDAQGRSLDGDADGTAGGDRADAFFRLYGDSDGDRDVDLRDLGRFLSTLGRQEGDAGFLWYMDVNDDDRVGLVDLFAFVRRLGTSLSP
jgi:uncharacterized protein (TIGR03118 family)